jgi:hypothetical protein
MLFSNKFENLPQGVATIPARQFINQMPNNGQQPAGLDQ